MGVIESEEYEKERQALMADPIVIAMAEGLANVPRSEMAHDSGGPRFEFMNAANSEYHKRGGTRSRSLGGVAQALLRLLGYQ